MEDKVNEKVIIISAKDLIKEKCIISYIESLTAGDMVSLVIEDPDRRLTDKILLISFNILTSNAHKSLHESAVQQNRTEVAAYLMEAIKKNGKSNSMRL